MSRYWSDTVQQPVPYVPGEQSSIARPIKLNTNENPYPPSSCVVVAVSAALSETGDSLRRYPDLFSRRLRETVAAHVGFRPEQVFTGNGSGEVLAHVLRALFKHDKPPRFPDTSYSFYPTYTRLYGVQHEVASLADDFSIRVDDYPDDAGDVLFPNPNVPTGHTLPLAEIERIAAANPSPVVVVDEAYADFGVKPAIVLIHHHSNLLVIHTTSKSRSLAGMRIGFALGHAALIEAFNRVKGSLSSYPLDRPAQAAAQVAYEDDAYLRTTCVRVVVGRTRLTQALQALGFEVVLSMANFVFTRYPAHDTATLAARLKEQAIFVRHLRLARIDQHLCITVGTGDECDAFLNTLRGLLK